MYNYWSKRQFVFKCNITPNSSLKDQRYVVWTVHTHHKVSASINNTARGITMRETVGTMWNSLSPPVRDANSVTTIKLVAN